MSLEGRVFDGHALRALVVIRGLGSLATTERRDCQLRPAALLFDGFEWVDARASQVVTVRPTLERERAILASGRATVAGVDEVGRGALAGPVAVGVVVLESAASPPPPGLADSKALSPSRREMLVPLIGAWAACTAVGFATAGEIDEIGIVRALRLAGERALYSLELEPARILLDGNFDWLNRAKPPPGHLVCEGEGPSREPVARSRVARSRLARAEEGAPTAREGGTPRLNPAREPRSTTVPALSETPSGGGLAPRVGPEGGGEWPVELEVRADCYRASVAAASVLAKHARDRQLVALDEADGRYDFARNKGYGTPGHLAALRSFGPSPVHRRSFRLLGPAEP